jgi:hypothetical protein
MLLGAIAANPGRYDGAGEYRYCRTCDAIFFTRATKPEPEHDAHLVLVLPALSQDGSDRLIRAFKAFTQRWSDERREQIERFAQRKGWELAMEHAHGGGALTDDEVAQWRKVVEAELQRLVAQARKQIAKA